MRLSAVGFLAGVCLLNRCHRLPENAELLALTVAAVACLCMQRLRLAGCILAGFCWMAWQAHQVLLLDLPTALEGRDLLIRGEVVGLPEKMAGKRLRLRMDIEACYLDGGWHTLRLPVRLNAYRHHLDIQPQERWQLTVRLKAAHGFANPGGFDYQRWLFAHGIRATGYIKKSGKNQLLPGKSRVNSQLIRYRIANHLDNLDVKTPVRGLLKALAIGDRSGLSRHQWQVLQRTGTSHLIAISGLHVGLVATLVFFVVCRLWAVLGGARFWPAPKVAALSSMFLAMAYAVLAGFQVPAQRALIMVWIWMLSIVLGVRTRPWQIWSLALLLVTISQPLSVLTAGFWLSFSAVGLILYLTRGRYGETSRVKKFLFLQLGLVAGLTPVLWIWFQQASLLAPFANPVAIPWVGFLIVPLILLGLFLLPLSSPAADFLFKLAGQNLAWLQSFLERLDSGPTAQWYTSPLSLPGYMLFSFGLMLLILPRGTRWRSVAVLVMISVLFTQPARPSRGDVWMTLLDVGQGLATVLQTAGHTLVYDTGPVYPSGFDTGAAVVTPVLRRYGVTRLDRLIISHSDSDHSGGGKSLYQNILIEQVDSGEPGLIPWAKANDCRRQPAWQWDRVRFEYLTTTLRSEGNNASCVLKVTAGDGRSLLFPGDIERHVEAALLEHKGSRLEAALIVAPHHGSMTSSTDRFVQAVKPEWALFATGYRNRFGFPRAEVIARYQAAGARWMDTASAGAISVKLEAGRSLDVTAWRHRQKRIWYR